MVLGLHGLQCLSYVTAQCLSYTSLFNPFNEFTWREFHELA